MKNFHSHESQVGKLRRKQTKDPTLFPSIMRWPRQTVKQTSELHKGQLFLNGFRNDACKLFSLLSRTRYIGKCVCHIYSLEFGEISVVLLLIVRHILQYHDN